MLEFVVENSILTKGFFSFMNEKNFLLEFWDIATCVKMPNPGFALDFVTQFDVHLMKGILAGDFAR